MNKKNIKVLHIGLCFNLGGIEQLVYTWLENKPSNFKFDFINACEEPLAKEEWLLEKGCNIYKVDRRFTHPIKRYKQLKNIIAKGNYDYIHCHAMYNDDPVPIILANKYNCKVIVHCHSMYTGRKHLRQRLAELETKMLIKNRKYIKLACSQEAGLNMFGNDFTVIENGIDVEKFIFSEKSRDKIKRKYRLTNKDKVIGHVGRNSFEKNYPFIINTFKNALNENKNLKLMLVGDLLNYTDLLKEIEEKQIKDKVILTGRVNNVEEYYSAFDLFYLPSLYEGLSITTIEAQASGLFCLLSNGVPKSAAVTKNVKFIKLEEKIATKELLTNINNTMDRTKIKINMKYDSKNASKKMFDFYNGGK